MSARYNFDVEPDARLPRLRHPDCRGPVNHHLASIAKADDNASAARLRPFVERIRQRDAAT